MAKAKRVQKSGAAKRALAAAKRPAPVVAKVEPVTPAPLRYGVVRWRSLVRDAEGRGGSALHEALPRLNLSWKGLMVHWLDGCPCASCAAAEMGMVARLGVKGRAA